MRRAEPLLVICILAAALLIRCAALRADPPGWLSWSAGLYSDEGIYSEDARLWVLYGQHMQGDFHVSVIAPLQHHLLLWVFRHHTISLALVREVSVSFSVATLACFWLMLRVRYDRRTALIGLILLALSAPFALYNRMGLLEMPALFWLVAAFAALTFAEWTRSDRLSLATLLAAGLLAGIAVAWKATFLLGALAALAYAIWRHHSRSLAAVAGFLLLLVVYSIVYVLPHREEIANADRYYLTHQYLPHSLAGGWHNLRRGIVTGEGDGLLPYLAHFAPVLAILTVCALLPQLRCRRDVCLWLWLLIPASGMLLCNYTPSRYYLIFWPALVGLAACAVARLPRPALAAMALAAAVAVDCVLLGISWRERTYTMHDDARILEQVLPRDAWVAGQFAPSLCLDNSLRSMYVQKGLANDAPGALAALPMTHVLATRMQSPKDDPFAGEYDNLIAGPAGLKSLPVGRKFTVNVYANLNALP